MFLEKSVNIYAIPGWGFSSKIFTILATTDLTMIGLDYFSTPFTTVESIAIHISKVVPDNSVLLGWSFNGLIAIQLASLFPDKVKKLILISSQPKFLSDIDWIEFFCLDKADHAGFLIYLSFYQKIIKKFLLT